MVLLKFSWMNHRVGFRFSQEFLGKLPADSDRGIKRKRVSGTGFCPFHSGVVTIGFIAAFRICKVSDSLNLKIYSPEDLAFTDNFSTSSLIGKTQFGRVYQARIQETGKKPQSVTIKTWNDRVERYMHHDDQKVLLEEERRFLTLPPMATHPNLVNLIGYCCEEEMKGVVYDLNSMDTLHNLMRKGIVSSLKETGNWL
ncbi:hypothetical protein CCACVL1_04723 [Corchorus capsularis]|uniref:Protein kinase domain-containing protein n=1 Tax=Corchorus capsularis TaxID=210143 RepID=A0A1R3JQG7_COCAP|nr:hypothetical protein CCACVL1_04723 [Corchorus capsularis]